MSGIARQSTARRGLGAAVNASQRHYPMSEMRPALQLLAAADTADAGAGIILEYTNRVTGGPVMPTIACHMQLLRSGDFSDRAYTGAAGIAGF